MKTGYGFTEFENIKEFEKWLKKQKVSRAINKLQVHHMYAPSYKNWKTDNALRRQNNIKSFHKNTNGWGDIAQHFSIFPDGHIVTGRSLNSTPIGIKGWNTGAICIEIYGDFDKGRDIMNLVQKEAIIGCYALLAKKFNISVNSNHIRPHAWFTAKGTYLGDYNKYKSAKSCPGTNFMGYGNTKSAFERFYKDIRNYQSTGNMSNNATSQNITEISVNQTGLVSATSLNVRSGAGTNYSVLGKLKNNTQVSIVAKCGNSWVKIRFGGEFGYVNSKYLNNIKDVSISSTTPSKWKTGDYNCKVRATVDLNARAGRSAGSPIVNVIPKGTIFTLGYVHDKWGSTWDFKDRVSYICCDYIEKVSDVSTNKEFKVKITCNTLNVRSGASTKHKVITKVYKDDIYTIIEEKDGWGLLKSKVGWICLDENYIDKI